MRARDRSANLAPDPQTFVRPCIPYVPNPNNMSPLTILRTCDASLFDSIRVNIGLASERALCGLESRSRCCCCLCDRPFRIPSNGKGVRRDGGSVSIKVRVLM